MRRILGILLTLLIIMNISACSNSNDDTKAIAEETVESNNDIIIRLAGGDWGFPSPYLHYSRGPGGFKMYLLFDSLLEKDENGIIPWIASEWRIENEGKDYIFTLNDNILWHDGEKLTPEDIKFTFDYYKQHPPVWNSLNVNGKYIVKNVEIIDETNLKIVVDSANATYLERLGKARILPKHIWKDVKDPKKFHSEKAAIGCGPYRFVEYNREQGAYKFEAFENYWGPKQRVKAIEWVPVSDEILAFEKGEIDTVSPSPDIIGRYEKDKGYAIKTNKGFWGYRLIFNMEKRSELKNINLRKAFAYGIDREEMVDKVSRGAAIAASMGYISKEHIWYNDNIQKYSYEPEKAKKFLKGKSYSFEILTGNKGAEIKIAELIKMTLKDIGIEIKIKSVDMKTRDAAVKNKEFEIALIGHGGWGSDPDSLREIYGTDTQEDGSPSSNSLPGYYNEKIIELSQKQMKELDKDKRKEIIYRLQELIAEEVPQIPLYNTRSYFVFRPLKYDGWMYTYDHHYPEHCKLSYLVREK
ncbi:ABC transporter substrate-binding protein [Paramaledivibacter caminithermalis]|uniref:Peptide/nickel transport system substrate-binding protein n=1 Tax=Paramaledivibacter caminithermalis (strain DSM 15212 / CIP 107654 / DViRD3) TaxID=1121301 RepID=A0A1M6QPS0_PARC5|nr:ABC transporter substrate-binding protein [Paramaledivibacter caminithermalis]SHK22138.1 peptide/nickel transport system substrate-binding protein [Paramaledivibacter caminithermalis DSM 15212]